MNFNFINAFSNTGGGGSGLVSTSAGTSSMLQVGDGNGGFTVTYGGANGDVIYTAPGLAGKTELVVQGSSITSELTYTASLSRSSLRLWGTDGLGDTKDSFLFFKDSIQGQGTSSIVQSAPNGYGTNVTMYFDSVKGRVSVDAGYENRPLMDHSLATIKVVKNYAGTSFAGTLGTAGMIPFLKSATQGTSSYRLKWDTTNNKLVNANGNSGTSSMTENVFGINVLGAQTALGSGYINLQSNGGLNLNGVSIIAGNALTISNSYTPTSANHIPLLSTVQAYVGTRVNSPSSIPLAGDNYTLVLGDANGIVEGSAPSPMTIYIPTNASTAIPLYTRILIVQYGAGAVTIQGQVGVTLNGVSAGSVVTSAQYQSYTLYKRATNEWVATR